MDYKPGLTEETLHEMKLRDEIHSELKHSRGENRVVLWKRFKKVRNRCINLVRRDNKARLKSEIFSNSDSARNIWKLVDQLNSKDCNPVIHLREEGVEVTDEEQVAETFNLFFKSKIESLRNKIDMSEACDPMGPLKNKKRFNKKFCLKTVSTSDVFKKIKSLKNKASCGADTITAQILKDASPVLTSPITAIVNASIRSGTFPDPWKEAQVVPILKKGSAMEKKNYRPVSLLSVVSKILEMVVQEQLALYFEENDLLPREQHGFRRKRNTTSALLSMFDRISIVVVVVVVVKTARQILVMIRLVSSVGRSIN